MLIKIDHKVSYLVKEDLADFVKEITRSSRMYSWVQGEDITDTTVNFALANRNATVGDYIEWTKRTYLDRAQAKKDNTKFDGFKLVGDYNPTRPMSGTPDGRKEELGKHGVTEVGDYVPARPKQRTDLKRVPEEEAEKDDLEAMKEAKVIAAQRAENTKKANAPFSNEAEFQEKDAAQKANINEGFEGGIPKDLDKLKPIEPGQQADRPDEPPVKKSPLEQHLAGKK
jgi:hypothetical protein